MRRRAWILKTVAVEPPPWRQRISGLASSGGGCGEDVRAREYWGAEEGGASVGGGESRSSLEVKLAILNVCFLTSGRPID